ncbi:MAG: ATP-dependent helicase, partial [Bdellovibrionales bacterium]|nr:ATP-dependent helicase [Bdellovibrionales bacterium]
MEQARLMVERGVLEQYHKLPKDVCKRISGFIADFERDPQDPRLYIHKLDAEMADPKVRGAKLPGGYRAILIKPEKGNTWLLVHVAPHDKAYAWAKDKRFEVHGKTGIFQIFSAEQAQRAADEVAEAFVQEPEYPLSKLSDEELFQAGVPSALIPSVRAIRSDEYLDALSEYLPLDCREVLTGIAAGMSLDEALESVLGQDSPADALPSGTGDFSALDKSPSFNLVLLDSDELLREALERPLEAWRVFLHPQQKRIVEKDVRGPMKITGAAGTGKTVALLHRAAHLAKIPSGDGKRVLVLTFTVNLAANIKKLLQDLDADAAERIDVANLSSFARTVCRDKGWTGAIKHPSELDDIWQEVFATSGLPELPLATNEELRKEFELVIDPAGIDDEESYLTLRRRGRDRLGRKQRRAVWEYVVALRKHLKKRDILTPNAAIKQARLAMESEPSREWAHVLVDEAQDFGLEALRLVRAVSPDSEESRNPLTLAGDGHQRVYGVQVPFSRAGINVVGRSYRLRVNYRTSQQIRRWAQAILEGQEIDDLDEATTSVKGDLSAFSGPDPEIVECANTRQEAQAVVDWVQSLLEQG